VGYVHPFTVAPNPESDSILTHGLPINAALGKLDYIEVVGFSDHIETASVWYRLMNCGLRPVAAAGTDAMANYASLRGPVGLARVYVDTGAELDFASADATERTAAWLEGLRQGRTMATNGPLLDFELAGQGPGSEIRLQAGQSLDYSGFMRSIVNVGHLEVVVNGEVVRSIELDKDTGNADFSGKLELQQNSWVLLRAWSDQPSPDVLDIYPYATTNPVYVQVDDEVMRSTKDADYFIAWIDRVTEAAASHPDYNTDEEKRVVLENMALARQRFEQCRQESDLSDSAELPGR